METNHILIVEDDKEIREGVQIYLQSQGYKVFQAADGVEGLEVMEKGDSPCNRGCDDAKDGWNQNDDEAEGEV